MSGWPGSESAAFGSDEHVEWALRQQELRDIRNAALEEAAAEMEHREQVATTARDSYLKINSPEDAARHEHYRVAYGSGAAAIRDLKGE
jgi:hypothetical protein